MVPLPTNIYHDTTNATYSLCILFTSVHISQQNNMADRKRKASGDEKPIQARWAYTDAQRTLCITWLRCLEKKEGMLRVIMNLMVHAMRKGDTSNVGRPPNFHEKWKGVSRSEDSRYLNNAIHVTGTAVSTSGIEEVLSLIKCVYMGTL